MTEGDVEMNNRGSVILKGVEFNNMGKADSENSGVHFHLTNMDGVEETLESTIEGCSVHDCLGQCVNAYLAKMVNLRNNVIYSGYKFLI